MTKREVHQENLQVLEPSSAMNVTDFFGGSLDLPHLRLAQISFIWTNNQVDTPSWKQTFSPKLTICAILASLLWASVGLLISMSYTQLLPKSLCFMLRDVMHLINDTIRWEKNRLNLEPHHSKEISPPKPTAEDSWRIIKSHLCWQQYFSNALLLLKVVMAAIQSSLMLTELFASVNNSAP